MLFKSYTPALVALIAVTNVSAITLGSTINKFGLLAHSSITNSGTNSIVHGNVGITPGGASSVTGLTSNQILGQLHAADQTALTAQSEAQVAYDQAVALTGAATQLTDQNLGSMVLLPGTYHFDTSAQLTESLTFDGGGDGNAEFVIIVGTTLTTSVGSTINLAGGARGCGIFWAVGTSATIGTGSTFLGTVVAKTSITVNSGCSVHGGLYALGASVSMLDSMIAVQDCGAEDTLPTITSSTTVSSPTTTSTTSIATTGLPGTGSGTNPGDGTGTGTSSGDGSGEAGTSPSDGSGGAGTSPGDGSGGAGTGSGNGAGSGSGSNPGDGAGEGAQGQNTQSATTSNNSETLPTAGPAAPSITSSKIGTTTSQSGRPTLYTTRATASATSTKYSTSCSRTTTKTLKKSTTSCSTTSKHTSTPCTRTESIRSTKARTTKPYIVQTKFVALIKSHATPHASKKTSCTSKVVVAKPSCSAEAAKKKEHKHKTTNGRNKHSKHRGL